VLSAGQGGENRPPALPTLGEEADRAQAGSVSCRGTLPLRGTRFLRIMVTLAYARLHGRTGRFSAGHSEFRCSQLNWRSSRISDRSRLIRV